MQNTKHGTISTKEAAVRFTSIRHIAHIRRAPPTDSPDEAVFLSFGCRLKRDLALGRQHRPYHRAPCGPAAFGSERNSLHRIA